MKFDETNKAGRSGAKEAMEDFFNELLGSLAQSPLEPLVEQAEQEAKRVSLSARPPVAPESEVAQSMRDEMKSARANPITIKAREQHRDSLPATEPAEPRRTMLKTAALQLEERRLASNLFAQPVLPAAMPKPAPVVSEPATEQTTEIISPSTTAETSPIVVEAKPVLAQPIQTPKGQDPKKQQIERVADTPVQRGAQGGAGLGNARPQWAQSRFECLLFSVAGLTLAVPLVSLGAIYKLDKELTPLVGRASWFMGLYRVGERNVQVVDTAQWVMPDRWVPSVREGYRFVIRLGDANWGIATDNVQQAINLYPDEVRWRTERSKRPWLAGTVIEHMCALLDVDQLAMMLTQEARTRRH